MKMANQEENLVILNDFLETADCRLLIIFSTPQGQLTPTTTYPGLTKTKVREIHFLLSLLLLAIIVLLLLLLLPAL